MLLCFYRYKYIALTVFMWRPKYNKPAGLALEPYSDISLKQLGKKKGILDKCIDLLMKKHVTTLREFLQVN